MVITSVMVTVQVTQHCRAVTVQHRAVTTPGGHAVADRGTVRPGDFDRGRAAQLVQEPPSRRPGPSGGRTVVPPRVPGPAGRFLRAPPPPPAAASRRQAESSVLPVGRGEQQVLPLPLPSMIPRATQDIKGGKTAMGQVGFFSRHRTIVISQGNWGSSAHALEDRGFYWPQPGMSRELVARGSTCEIDGLIIWQVHAFVNCERAVGDVHGLMQISDHGSGHYQQFGDASK
jgi:hypothetical protein